MTEATGDPALEVAEHDALREAVAGTLALAYSDEPDFAFISAHDERTADAVLDLLNGGSQPAPRTVTAESVARVAADPRIVRVHEFTGVTADWLVRFVVEALDIEVTR